MAGSKALWPAQGAPEAPESSPNPPGTLLDTAALRFASPDFLAGSSRHSPRSFGPGGPTRWAARCPGAAGTRRRCADPAAPELRAGGGARLPGVDEKGAGLAGWLRWTR